MVLEKRRMRQIRERTTLSQEEFAFLLGVGVSTVIRWERSNRGTLPTGIPRQLYDVMHALDEQGTDLSIVRAVLQSRGNLGAIRFLLNSFEELEQRAF